MKAALLRILEAVAIAVVTHCVTTKIDERKAKEAEQENGKS